MLASSFSILRGSSLRFAATRNPVLVLPVARYRSLSTLLPSRHLSRPQKPLPDTRWRNLRWNSNTTAAAAAAASASSSPTSTSLPALEDIAAEAAALAPDVTSGIPPIELGSFQAMGLCHWTPAGVIQYSFELIHVLSGLPWFHTFIAATLFWRVVIFPFAVVGMRNSARMRPITKELNEQSMAIHAARAAGDTVGMQRASLAASKIRNDAGVSMLGLMAPMIQFPISLGLFFGVKRMCELPVVQFMQSGFDLLPDLTQPGPNFILPILVAASGNVMLTLSARDMDSSRPGMAHLLNIFRVVSVLAVYWMNQFPSGLLLCLLVTSVSTIAQTALFRVPAVRRVLRIPQWTPQPGGLTKLPSFRESWRYYLGQSQSGGVGAPRAAASPIARAYVPPKSPTPPRAVPTPRTLETIAQHAQANVNVKAAGMYEDAGAAVAGKAAAKKSTSKAGASVKGKQKPKRTGT